MIANRIRSLRDENDWTQEEVANKLGLQPGSYALYEQDRRKPDYEILVKIADLYNVTTDYLLCRTNDKNEVLRKPTANEALIIVAQDSNIPADLIRNYIDYLKAQNRN